MSLFKATKWQGVRKKTSQGTRWFVRKQVKELVGLRLRV